MQRCLILYIFLGVFLCSCDIEKTTPEKTNSGSSPIKTVRFTWDSLALPKDVAWFTLHKVSANATHVFFAYRIPRVNYGPVSGLLIKDTLGQIKILSDFSAPMKNQQIAATVAGFEGEISALTAIPGGAFIATKEKPLTQGRVLIAQIDNQGVFHSHQYFEGKRSEIRKLIALPKGLLSLSYDGLSTPTLYKGNALTMANNAINWNDAISMQRTASEMGDAALDMIIVDELKPYDLVAVSGGGIYRGEVLKTSWQYKWLSDPYINQEIFPGAPNSVAYYRNKLVVGSFSHPLNPNKSKGLIFCDVNKTKDKNPCESIKEATKDYEINSMAVFNHHLYLASSTGLLRYDGNELAVFRKASPTGDLANTEKVKYIAQGELPSDDIIDLSPQNDLLWIVTKEGVVSLKIE